MGTAIGLDLREPWIRPEAVDAFFDWLRSVDERFSTYRDDSLVSRLRRGEIASLIADPDLTQVLELCEKVRLASDGIFDVWTHHPDGFDPSGLVKGWSIDRGADILRAAGARNFCVNAGGDVLAIGQARPGVAWRVGIRHPVEADKVAAVVAASELAVATSGAYERGEHIINSLHEAAPQELLSVTVAGPSLTFADAYATAAFAMGERGVAWLGQLDSYGGYVVTAHQRAIWTDDFDVLLAT
jgi:thiamine biosynthesis lipoprotein